MDKQTQLVDAIEKYCAALTEKSKSHRFVWRKGRSYYKIGYLSNYTPHDLGCVEAFVDFEGNVYKPAGYERPAKGIRYNLFTQLDLVLQECDGCGTYLYMNHVIRK